MFDYTCQIHVIHRRNVWFVIWHVYYDTLCNDLRTCILFIIMYTLFWLIRIKFTINLPCKFQDVGKQHSSHSGRITSQPHHSNLWQESDIWNNTVKIYFFLLKFSYGTIKNKITCSLLASDMRLWIKWQLKVLIWHILDYVATARHLYYLNIIKAINDAGNLLKNKTCLFLSRSKWQCILNSSVLC